MYIYSFFHSTFLFFLFFVYRKTHRVGTMMCIIIILCYIMLLCYMLFIFYCSSFGMSIYMSTYIRYSIENRNYVYVLYKICIKKKKNQKKKGKIYFIFGENEKEEWKEGKNVEKTRKKLFERQKKGKILCEFEFNIIIIIIFVRFLVSSRKCISIYFLCLEFSSKLFLYT